MPAKRTWIDDRLAELGLTRPQMAERLGVTQQAFNKFALGITRDPRYVVRLARELGKSINWVLTGREDGGAPVEHEIFDIVMRLFEGEKVQALTHLRAILTARDANQRSTGAGAPSKVAEGPDDPRRIFRGAGD